MRLAIMQPYFLPYIGYFQLMSSADMFVVYDDLQYTKRGWINRNRILVNGADSYITIALRSASDFLDIRQRELSPDFDRMALLNRLRGAYLRAPFFGQTMEIISEVIENPASDLFTYLRDSLDSVSRHVGVTTTMVPSSKVPVEPGMRGQDRVLAICHALGADSYVNASGGRALYAHADFAAEGIELSFIDTLPFDYPQFGGPFVPSLSIVDVLMYNDIERVRDVVATGYRLA